MTDFSRRQDVPEEMDDPDLPAETYQRCLTDLAAVNRWTMTHRATLAWLTRATRGLPPGAEIRVLDVAYGDGDLLRAIHRWASRAGFRPVLAGVDLNPRSAAIATAATPADMAIDWRTGDVFDHIPSPAPDFIVSSQFAHHLSDAMVVELLRWMQRHAGRGWFIADLHRHVVPYYGFAVLGWAMRWHRIVVSDGRASILRAFRRDDWTARLREAGIEGASIRWLLPFRYGVGRRG